MQPRVFPVFVIRTGTVVTSPTMTVSGMLGERIGRTCAIADWEDFHVLNAENEAAAADISDRTRAATDRRRETLSTLDSCEVVAGLTINDPIWRDRNSREVDGRRELRDSAHSHMERRKGYLFGPPHAIHLPGFDSSPINPCSSVRICGHLLPILGLCTSTMLSAGWPFPFDSRLRN